VFQQGIIFKENYQEHKNAHIRLIDVHRSKQAALQATYLEACMNKRVLSCIEKFQQDGIIASGPI